MENITALQPGTVLRSEHGEYTIKKILGQGGFGITYLVEGVVKVGNINATVEFAVKEHFISSMCSREGATQQVAFSQPVADTVQKSLSSFIKEARRVQNLGVEHPNIIKFNEVFEANNTAYYVMEYLNGITLEQFVAQRGRLTPKEAEDMIRPIAEAMALLHSRKLTHYDIKPQNIIITTDSNGILRPVLIDFGLSKHYDSSGSATSMIDMVGFSKGYAPIEQYYGLSEFTPEADVYALAATLYYCLTGHNPEDAALFHPEEKLTEYNVSLPDYMRQGLLRGLQLAKRDRTPDIPTFIRETFGGEPIPVGNPVSGSHATQINYTQPTAIVAPQMPPADNAQSQKQKSKLWIWGVVATVVIAIAIGAYFFIANDSGSKSRGNGRSRLESRAGSSTSNDYSDGTSDLYADDIDTVGGAEGFEDESYADASFPMGFHEGWNEFTADMIDGKGKRYPFTLKFYLDGSHNISDVVYHNVGYGGTIKMENDYYGSDEVKFSGTDRGNTFTITFSGNNPYYGESYSGDQRLDAELHLQ